MTVEELIAVLQAIEDKTLPVTVADMSGAYRDFPAQDVEVNDGRGRWWRTIDRDRYGEEMVFEPHVRIG